MHKMHTRVEYRYRDRVSAENSFLVDLVLLDLLLVVHILTLFLMILDSWIAGSLLLSIVILVCRACALCAVCLCVCGFFSIFLAVRIFHDGF